MSVLRPGPRKDRELLMKKLVEVEMDGQAAAKQAAAIKDAAKRLKMVSSAVYPRHILQSSEMAPIRRSWVPHNWEDICSHFYNIIMSLTVTSLLL